MASTVQQYLEKSLFLFLSLSILGEFPQKQGRYLMTVSNQERLLNINHITFFLQGLMRETASQTHNSGRYTPKPIFSSKTENVAGTQTYSEYLSTVRTQIAATKELHDMLSEFSSTQLPQPDLYLVPVFYFKAPLL